MTNSNVESIREELGLVKRSGVKKKDSPWHKGAKWTKTRRMVISTVFKGKESLSMWSNCGICGLPLDKYARENCLLHELSLHVDHIKAPSVYDNIEGQKLWYDLDNLQVTHMLCNIKKSDNVLDTELRTSIVKDMSKFLKSLDVKLSKDGQRFIIQNDLLTERGQKEQKLYFIENKEKNNFFNKSGINEKFFTEGIKDYKELSSGVLW